MTSGHRTRSSLPVTEGADPSVGHRRRPALGTSLPGPGAARLPGAAGARPARARTNTFRQPGGARGPVRAPAGHAPCTGGGRQHDGPPARGGGQQRLK
ncbi:predicted protein [Streptomyces albidoflavus]|nr:predicted protein [Streptomyces albidoflavus]